MLELLAAASMRVLRRLEVDCLRLGTSEVVEVSAKVLLVGVEVGWAKSA